MWISSSWPCRIRSPRSSPASLSTPVVDLGADFRLRDATAWQTYYGGQHAGTWTYGMPEIPGQRELIAASKNVANPGCYATAIALAAAPLVRAGLVDATQIVAVAASGTSGAGRSPSVPLLASEVTSGMRPYKVGGVHQHTPEIEQTLGHGARISFTPMLAPMARGILATVTAPLTGGSEQIGKALHDAYGDEPFVRVLPDGQWPATQMTLGSNSVVLQWAVDDHAGRVIVCSAIDNLGKGAAGQAIQNANLMLGSAREHRASCERSGAVSVTFAQGFRAAGVVAGLKASGTPDVAVVINDGPRWDAAAVFTSNRDRRPRRCCGPGRC